MSKLETNTIDTVSGSNTLTLGSTNTSTISVGSPISNGLTLSDNILFDTASKGIYLGVTSATASNLLDDYEEGTFTPEFADAISGGNTATVSASGRYTKIGNLVTTNMHFINIDTSGMTGGNSIFIRNIPFVIGSTPNPICAVLCDRINFDQYVVAMGSGGNSYINLRNVRDSNTDLVVTVSDVTSVGSDLQMTFTYRT